MNLLLVSERPAVVGDHAARPAVEELARALVAAGHSVTWLRPRLPEEPAVTDVEGVRVLSESSEAPPFGSVTGRLYDVPNEKLLVEELRLQPPDLVHVHGFGGTSSYLPPWLCERLGVPVLVVVRSIAAVLCARHTLVDELGRDCVSWADADRCFECCTTPFEGGLTPGEAWRARHLTWLGPWAPSPVRAQFANRLDMVVHGLDSADRVLCADEESAELLRDAGLPGRARVGIPDPSDVGAWLALYRELLADPGAAG